MHRYGRPSQIHYVAWHVIAITEMNLELDFEISTHSVAHQLLQMTSLTMIADGIYQELW